MAAFNVAPAAAQVIPGVMPPNATTNDAGGTELQDPAASDIIVIGRRRGVARGNLRPIETIDAERLQSARGLTIDQVVQRLARSGQNNPNILINGRPADTTISVGGLPSGAIERIEILPPGTAVSYGEQVNGRVINVVLRSQFRSLQVSGQATVPQNARDPDTNATLQRSVIEDNRQTSLTASVSRTIARRDTGQSDGALPVFLSPGMLDVSANAQIERPGWRWRISLTKRRGRSAFSNIATVQVGIEPLTNNRSNWGLGSTFSLNGSAFSYALRAGIDGTRDDQRSPTARSISNAVNAQVNASLTATLLTFARGTIQTTNEVSWRVNWGRNRQFTDGLMTERRDRISQIDGRAGLAIQWSNGRGQDPGAIMSSLGVDLMRVGGNWGQNATGSVMWMPLPRLTSGTNGTLSSMKPMQMPLVRPLAERVRVFDIVTDFEREVTVLRDGNPDMLRVRSTQIDLNVNYAAQGRWPFNLSLNIGRSSNSGQFDRPDAPSTDLQLRQPVRYLRDPTGLLKTVDLRTRRLSARQRFTIGLQGNLAIPLVAARVTPPDTARLPGENKLSRDAETSAADAIASTATMLNLSFGSQWLSVDRRTLRDDGFGEPVNRLTLFAEVTRGRSSLSLGLDRVSAQQTRDIDGSLFTIPPTLHAALELAVPLRFKTTGEQYFDNTQLRLSIQNIRLFEGRQSPTANPQNRFSASNQRGVTATLALATSF